MLFTWNEQTFQWFEDTSEYTGYNRELAKRILPHLKDCQTICDIGCGMALVDFELAKNFAQVDCVDINEAVIQNVRDRAEKNRVSNLQTVLSDGMEQTGIYDGVMALFHGSIETVGERYLSFARKRLILAVHASAFGSTGPAKYRIRKCCDVDSTTAWLEEHGLSYTIENMELEFGQPHRSLEDAIAFTRTFTRNVPEEELATYVKEHVIETGRTDFPLYTPKKRQFGLFAIEVPAH